MPTSARGTMWASSPTRGPKDRDGRKVPFTQGDFGVVLTEGNVTSIQKCYALFCENHEKDLIDKCFQVCDNITGRTMKEVRKDGNFAKRRCVAFMQCLSLRNVIKSKRVNAHEPPKGDLCAFYILGGMYCELSRPGRLCRWEY